MIKRTLTTLITALVIAAVPALAGIVTVDFDVNADLTNIVTPVDLNGHGDFGGPTTLYGIISVSYFSPDAVNEQAAMDAGGIFGLNFNGDRLEGALMINFKQLGVQGLRFTYTTDNPGGLDASFGSPLGYDLGLESRSAATGTFTYGSMIDGTPSLATEFNSVSIMFKGTAFTVDSMEYNWVPEPASYLLFGTGLIGLGVVRRFRRGKA